MRKFLIIALIFCCISTTVLAQLNPLGAMYFQNQYLANAALAGENIGWELGGGYKAQWTSVEGAPSMQAITAAYGSKNKRAGFGFTFYNESAGVFRRTGEKLSYSYNIRLNKEETSYLSLGLSGGIMDEWIDYNKVKGDVTDQSLANFNQREIYFDGDFGAAFRSDRLTLQASLPNLKRLLDRDFERNIVDRNLYMAAASFKFFSANEQIVYQPKVVYRGVQNYKDIMDFGLNVSLKENTLFFNGIYHSTNSLTLGAGTVYKEQLTLLFQYTTNTSDLQGYTNGEFEVGLMYHFK